ncbi:MAG TPA: TetR/AcrR family transcriptional regulator [Candidatus Fermentibacter daniensis]|nr:MAG: HTH-type transcriptional regulator RutR [candidate division Hyd24-12 bacterium ADurb.Bin004]HPH40697.1 TetR/AcrR family transcriptional regulator [Candidatus Fermentibacter daniensis]
MSDEVSKELSSREAILEAAAEVFAGKGFDGARVDEIARRAGANKAMLYYHVGDKKALYDAVVGAIQMRGRAMLEKILGEGGDPRDMLRKAVGGFVSMAFSNPVAPAIILREIAGGGANMGEESVQRLETMLALVRRIIERGVDAGVMRPVDPAFAQFLVAGSVLFLAAGVPFRRRLAERGDPAGPLEPGELTDGLCGLLLGGLAKEND